LSIKDTQAGDFFCLNQNFIWPWPIRYSKKIRFFISTFARISRLEHFPSVWAMSIRKTNFLMRGIRKLFVLNVHFCPIRRYPWQFFKIQIIYSGTLHSNYDFLGTISSRKRGNVKKIEYLGRIEYDFQKSCVRGPWNNKDSVSAQKSI
jgi:hypothetical protein